MEGDKSPPYLSESPCQRTSRPSGRAPSHPLARLLGRAPPEHVDADTGGGVLCGGSSPRRRGAWRRVRAHFDLVEPDLVPGYVHAPRGKWRGTRGAAPARATRPPPYDDGETVQSCRAGSGTLPCSGPGRAWRGLGPTWTRRGTIDALPCQSTRRARRRCAASAGWSVPSPAAAAPPSPAPDRPPRPPSPERPFPPPVGSSRRCRGSVA